MSIIDGQINDIRLVGFLTTIFILCVALIGMKWEAKVCFFNEDPKIKSF